MASVSKKAKKEVTMDTSVGGWETESELPTDDESRYPDDLEDKMKGEGGAEPRLILWTNQEQC